MDILAAHIPRVGRDGRPLSAQGTADPHAGQHLHIPANLDT